MNLVPQFGFFELMLVAIVALIVVGPRDLPKLMRGAGRFIAKARELAGEFTAAFDQMARESEVEELRQEIEALKKNNPATQFKREVEESLAPVDQEIRNAALDASGDNVGGNNGEGDDDNTAKAPVKS